MSLVNDLKAYATQVAKQGAEAQAAALEPQLRRAAIWSVAKTAAPFALGALGVNLLAALVWSRAKRQLR